MNFDLYIYVANISYTKFFIIIFKNLALNYFLENFNYLLL